MTNIKANPYDSSFANNAASRRRKTHTLALVALGAMFGMVAMSYGHIKLAGLIEKRFCPPLESMGNMGQYGIVFILLGFWGFVLGGFTGMLAIFRDVHWVLIYSLMVWSLSVAYSEILLGYGLCSTFTWALAIWLVILPLPNLAIVKLELRRK